MIPFMNIIRKNQEKKKSMKYIFQVGIDFERTRMYGDFDWSGSVGRTWFQEPFKGYKKLHYLSKEYGTQSIRCTGHC